MDVSQHPFQPETPRLFNSLNALLSSITQPPTQGLTIYLLKTNYQSAERAIKEVERLAKHDLVAASGGIGQLFVEKRAAKPPRWARFFSEYLTPQRLGLVSTASAILLVKSETRLFAVSFGQGRHLLEPDAWEERFGLRVALNSIGERNVRSIDKRRLDPLSLHSRSQASREASAREFEIDVEQDLLRAITGTPISTELGIRLTGMDSLHTAIPTNLESLRNLLALYYTKYQDTTYKKTFPWVDHIAEVNNKIEIDQLNNEIIERIIAGNTERIWMALPDIVQWERVDKFRYGQGKRYPRLHDIHLSDFLNTIPNLQSLSKEMLVRRKVLCVDDDGVVIENWQAYRCLYAEIEREQDTYLLTSGRWFRITTDFVTTVNKAFAKIPRYEEAFPEYQDQSETFYNKRVARDESGRFALMDRKMIGYGGGHSSIEFCDLYTRGKDIIHVKRYGSSSHLSHLFAQGQISGEVFQTDSVFRNKVNSLLPTRYKIDTPQNRPLQDEFQVVFAIISDIKGPLVLPFFSRLHLRNACNRLIGFGYKVALAKIDVDERFALTKQYE